MNSFLSENELKKIGFKKIGKNVLVSRNASIYGAENISLGNNIRIDDFCILSGTIDVGDYVHISAYTGLFAGDAGIIISDYATISSRNCIYAISDDYSGEFMTNPMIPEKYRNVRSERVIIEKYVIIGSGCTVLPGVCLREGTSVGAMSLVKTNTEAWGQYIGIPARRYADRSKKILDKVKELECNE